MISTRPDICYVIGEDWISFAKELKASNQIWLVDIEHILEKNTDKLYKKSIEIYSRY